MRDCHNLAALFGNETLLDSLQQWIFHPTLTQPASIHTARLMPLALPAPVAYWQCNSVIPKVRVSSDLTSALYFCAPSARVLSAYDDQQDLSSLKTTAKRTQLAMRTLQTKLR
jgi:hypothetical protein